MRICVSYDAIEMALCVGFSLLRLAKDLFYNLVQISANQSSDGLSQ